MNKERVRLKHLSVENPSHCYYVYVHRRLGDNKPFYVGKGKNGRAWSTFGRSKQWNSIVNKYGFTVDIVFEGLEECEAFQCEVDVIKEFKYFEYKLCNYTNGGEGLSGFKWSDEQMKNHPSLKNKGRIQSSEEIEKRRKSMMGHAVTDNTKLKLRESKVSNRVFVFIVKELTHKRNLPIWLKASLLNIDPRSLYKKPTSYTGFSREQIEKSAVLRRGKPSWNSGKTCPEFAGTFNSSADNTVYSFIRVIDGLKFTGTRYELVETFGLNLAQVGKLFYTKARDVSQGWKLDKETNGTN